MTLKCTDEESNILTFVDKQDNLNTEAENIELGENKKFAGHPAGLATLFFTELWERFSYYGMRAILLLYMVASVKEGGLGMSMREGASIYGNYTMLVYMTSIPGGIIADKYLGQKMSILIGGIIIALGHFTLAFPSLPTFYTGLGLIILGTGLLKPNISTLLGKLYAKGDPRRDSGFSIFYMGINIGAALSPIVCGFLAQSQEFKNILLANGQNPLSCWHWGFAAAGVGMTLGLLHFILQAKNLGQIGSKPAHKTIENLSDQRKNNQDKLTSDDWKKLAALSILFFFTMMFWAIYEQGGSSLNVFADKLTQCEIFSWQFPSSWLQSLQAIFVICLAPCFSWLWLRLGDKEPSSPAKFTIGLSLLGAGIAIMIPASILATTGKVSPLWLTAVYFLEVAGELCLSPVGLSTVTKLAPKKIAAMTMGLWFLATAFGNFLAGQLAAFFDNNKLDTLVYLYGGMTLAVFLGVILLLVLTPTVRKLMIDVR